MRRVDAEAPTILVVDDDDDFRDAVAQVLADAGYEVATATDGAAGVTHLETSPPPALIVLDLMMPGVDGWTLLARLIGHPTWSEIPVIVCTAYDDRVAPRAGVPVLRKPFSLDTLLARVQSLVPPPAAT